MGIERLGENQGEGEPGRDESAGRPDASKASNLQHGERPRLASAVPTESVRVVPRESKTDEGLDRKFTKDIPKRIATPEHSQYPKVTSLLLYSLRSGTPVGELLPSGVPQMRTCFADGSFELD